MFFSPFEQFEILVWLKAYLPSQGLDMSLTNISISICAVSIFYVFASKKLLEEIKVVPSNWQIFYETIYLFIVSIVYEQATKKGIRYFPHLFTIFALILSFNLVGLLPFSFTVTSHIIVTLTLALSYFFAWILIGIFTLRMKFLNLFCPKNMPIWLLPLLIVIETLSFALRPFSLGIRLFANMLAGHILLHILADSLLFALNITAFLLIPLFVILLAIGFLELFIACLQAYIFTILLSIYLKDALVSH